MDKGERMEEFVALEGGFTREVEEATRAASEGERDRFSKFDGVGEVSLRNGLLSSTGDPF